MKGRTGWRWGCWMVSGACVLSACGGDNGASPTAPPSESVSGVAHGTQSKPPADAGNQVVGAEAAQDVPAALHVGGTVYGLAKNASLKLFNNHSELVTVSDNGAFAFSSPASKGARFDVTVAVQPQGQRCDVERAGGQVDSSSNTAVEVHCSDRQQIAVVMTDKGTISSYRIDPRTSALTRAPGASISGTFEKRRLMVSPRGSMGYVIRSDLPYGEKPVESPMLRPLGAFEINLASGELGKLNEVNWESPSGRALDYAFNPHDFTMTVLQLGTAYGLVNMNAEIGRVYGSRMFSNTVVRIGKNPHLDWGQCQTNYQRTRSTMTHELIGNLRQVHKGEFGYLLRCDPERHGYRIEGYRIDRTNEGIRSIDVGDWAQQLRFSEAFDVNPQGTLMFTVDGFKPRLDVVRIDAATGRLQLAAQVKTPERPSRVVVSRDGLTVYVMHMADERISAYSVDPASGATSPVPGSPFHVGKLPLNMVIDASQTFAYVLLEGEDALAVFSIDPKTKALEWVRTVPFEGGAHEIALTS